MKKKERKQTKKELKDLIKSSLGNITAACQKAGISRGTYYNWRKQDKEWAQEIDEIKNEADERMNDLAEGKLYTKVREGDNTCLIFYLKTRHPKYKRKSEVEVKGRLETSVELSEEEKELIKKGVQFAIQGEVAEEEAININELDLEDNIKEILIEQGLENNKDIKEVSDKALLSIKGIGEKSLEKIKEAL